MKTLSKILLTVAAVVTLAFATPVFANLVTNPGFETGDFTGWTQFGNMGQAGVFTPAAHSGMFGAEFGFIGSTGGIFQGIPTVAGNTYDLTFWLQNFDGSPNFFDVSWNGISLFSFTDAGPFGYTMFSFSGLLATTAQTDLRFTFRHDPLVMFLDDVSVESALAPPSVPEAFSTLWLALPFAGMVGFQLRRKLI